MQKRWVKKYGMVLSELVDELFILITGIYDLYITKVISYIDTRDGYVFANAASFSIYWNQQGIPMEI